MKIKNLLFNPVHPVKKLAATLLLSAGWWLNLSGSANAAITTTASGISADDNDTFTTRVESNYFEYRQTNPGKVLTISVPTITSSDTVRGAFNGSTLATAGNVTFAYCSATNTRTKPNGFNNGGAACTSVITHSDSGTLAFVSNVGSSGGAVSGNSTLTMSGSYDAITIASNIGYGYGGAFSANTISLNNSARGALTISDNSAGYTGGAFDADNITLSGTYGAIVISSNASGFASGRSGGAFYSSNNIELNSSVSGTLTISGNRGLDNKGGAFSADSGTITLRGNYGAVAIVSNTASTGGAFFAGKKLIFSATVTGNLVLANNGINNHGGGGLFYVDGEILFNNKVGGDLTISGNRADCVSNVVNNGLGGAFKSYNIVFNNAVGGNLNISGNVAYDTGGALYAYRSGNATDDTIELHNLVGGTLNISNNLTHGDGGALYAKSPITLSGSYGAILISSNTGGAFYSASGLILTATVARDLTLSGNYASGGGGAFATNGNTQWNSTVGGNLNLSGNIANSDGGALNSNNPIVFTGAVGGNLSISGNRAGNDGGAIRTNTVLTLSPRVTGTLSISGNTAGRDGGAFVISNGTVLSGQTRGTLTVSGSYGAVLISSNTAARNGGVLCAPLGLNINLAAARGISVLNNRASNGGAFYAGNGFNLTLAASATLSASGNKAAANNQGGFLYLCKGDLVFDLGANALAQIGNANSIANQTDSMVIDQSVSVYKRGAGTLQLWADNPFSDNFYVNAGVLDLRGKIYSTRTEVASGATLKGSGTTVGSVVIYSGGTIAPGDGPGVLTTGTLTLNDGAALSLNLNAATGSGHTHPAGNSLLVVNGNLTSVGTAQIDLTLTAGPVNGAVYDLIKYSGTGSGNVNIRKLSGSGATGVKISDFKFVNTETGWLKLSYSGTTINTGTGGGGTGGGTEETWDLAGLTSKGLKLSAAKTLVVPKGVKLLKGTKAVYTWKRDGVTVLSGSGKNYTAKDSGTYTLTLSYTSADGQQHSQTQNFGKLKLFAQPKTATLTMTQTTDTITNSALRATSVVSGESLKLTVSVGTVGGGAVGPFRYVWYCGSAVVRTQQSSATTDTFTTPAYGDKAVGYKCVVELVAKDAKNKPLGTAKSKDLKAKIILPPNAVTLSASAATVKENGTLTLSASAKGTATLLFTWYKNGQQIATGSAKKFAKKPVTASDAGTYYVVVSQSQTTRRAQSSTLTVNIQRADGSTVSGAQSQSMSASPAEAVSTTATASSGEPRRQDAAGTLPSNSASILNLAPLSLSAGDILTVSGSATREYIIVNETQHTTGAYHYEWRDNLTAEFQDADDEAQLTLRFITIDGGVYELSVSGSVNETGVFELRKK